MIISKVYRKASGWDCFPKDSWRKKDEIHGEIQDSVIMGRRPNFVVGDE